MTRVGRECKGQGKTHHHACACREEHFAQLEKDAMERAVLLEAENARLRSNLINLVTACERGDPLDSALQDARAALDGNLKRRAWV